MNHKLLKKKSLECILSLYREKIHVHNHHHHNTHQARSYSLISGAFSSKKKCYLKLDKVILIRQYIEDLRRLLGKIPQKYIHHHIFIVYAILFDFIFYLLIYHLFTYNIIFVEELRRQKSKWPRLCNSFNTFLSFFFSFSWL